MAGVKVRTPVAALGLALALFLLIFVIGGLSVWQGYRDSLERGEQRAAVAAHTVAAHFQWIVEASRQALRRIDDTLDFRPALWNTSGIGDISGAIAGLPDTVEVRVFDAQGQEVLTTNPSAGELSVGDRSYFMELRDGQSFVISPLLVDRVTGRHSFVVAQRLERNRAFAGIAAIVIPSDLISGFWASLGLGQDSTASIIRDDGWIVARHPALGESINIANSPLFTRLLPKAPAGSYRSPASPADGMARLVGYYRVPHAPLVAIASVSTYTTLAEFRTRLRRSAIAGVPLLLGLLGFAWWVARLLATDERRRTEIEQALEQNRLLLREVHHRVKNNLQTVASLVRLQPMAPEARRDLSDRIAAMAAVHEQIYRSNRFGDVQLDGYLENIARSVASGYDSKVEIVFRGHDVAIDPDRAMILGLIVTELVSNSIKHAFPDGGPGEILIELERGEDGKAVLTLADRGVGFDPNAASRSLGLRLVRSFSEQLGGDYRLDGAGGLSYRLTLAAA